MAEKKKDIYQGCYGLKAKPSEIKEWILDGVKDNCIRCENNQPRSVLSIWGSPGTSKTSIVKSLQKEQIEFDGKLQKINIIDIPLAQIEEMGDVLGFPTEQMQICKDKEVKWVAAVDGIVKYYFENGWEPTGVSNRTVNAPPSWVPTEECPGVILFDDGNRASQRIMKGLMQLVQDYRTISWSLPRGWTIIFTGNPDNRYNQVTSMDSAQLTRMKHITLEIDAKEWAEWATENKLDNRGISFVLRYPEMMIGEERTNPRTLSEFFLRLKNYPKLSGKENQKEIRKCTIDAYASLDEITVETLMVFLKRDVELVIEPTMILEDSEKATKELARLMSGVEPRIDIISVIMDRLLAYLNSSDYKFDKSHLEPFKKWVLNEELPQDLSYAFLNSLVKGKCIHAKQLVSSPEILKMITKAYSSK